MSSPRASTSGRKTAEIGLHSRDPRTFSLTPLPLNVQESQKGETTWVRISKEAWDLCMRLFHSNQDDDPKGEFYNYAIIAGVVANDEYHRVLVDVNPMGERDEIEFHVRVDTEAVIEEGQAA